MTASVRFMTNNLIAAAGVVTTASSQLAGFEAANVFSDIRWKEWIQAGAFEIYSGNNKIYINDGAPKTITLTEATYGTAAAMAAHVQAQLNASSTNWTVTYSAGKFNFGRSSGTATLALTSTTDAAWDALGYTGAADFDAGTGTAADERRNHTSEWIKFDLLTGAGAPKALLMTNDADEDFSYPTDAVIKIRASNSDGDEDVWALAPLSVTISPEQLGAYKFWESTDETGYRYWRIDFIDRTNGDGPQFPINQMYLGPYFEPANFNLNEGFSRVLVDPKTTVESDSRSRYHRTRRKYWEYSSLVLDNIQDTDREEIERIVSEVGTSVPLWVALDPDAAISKTVGEFTKYVEFNADFQSSHIRYKRFSESLALREVV